MTRRFNKYGPEQKPKLECVECRRFFMDGSWKFCPWDGQMLSEVDDE